MPTPTAYRHGTSRSAAQGGDTALWHAGPSRRSLYRPSVLRRAMCPSVPYSKMPRGTVIETTQCGTSTISLILRSPATLQMA